MVSFVGAQEVVDGGGKFGDKLEAFVGDEVRRKPPQCDVPVNEDVGGAFCGEFGGSNTEHVITVAKTIGETQDVRDIAGGE